MTTFVWILAGVGARIARAMTYLSIRASGAVLASLALLATARSSDGEPRPRRAGDRLHTKQGRPRAFDRWRDLPAWAREFERAGRDTWQRPRAVLAALGLKPAMIVADIGSASGYFTVRLARAVPRGRVYGVDLDPGIVTYLHRRAAAEKLANLKSILGAEGDPRLPESVDLVFFCDTYHHIKDRVAYLRRVARRLRPGGRVAVVDPKAGMHEEEPGHEDVSPAQLDREMVTAGFARLLLDEKTLPEQYLAIYGARRRAPARPSSAR